MCPAPPGSVNSVSSTPILRSTHSIGSHPPVRTPMRGMSPSMWFFGIVSVPAGTLTMPKNHIEGDIPRIGVLTGGWDPMECVLRKMGVDDTEFTDPGGAGHIQFYLAGGTNLPPTPF